MYLHACHHLQYDIFLLVTYCQYCDLLLQDVTSRSGFPTVFLDPHGKYLEFSDSNPEGQKLRAHISSGMLVPLQLARGITNMADIQSKRNYIYYSYRWHT